MWKPADPHQVENIDNHLDAISRAKEELQSIREDIQVLLIQKSELIAGNAQILKDKLAQVDKNTERVIALQQAVQEAMLANEAKAAELQEKEEKQQTAAKILLEAGDKHFNFVNTKSDELLSREQELQASVVAHNHDKAQLLEISKSHADNLAKAQELYAATQKLSEEVSQKSVAAQEKMDEALDIDANAKIIYQEAIQVQLGAKEILSLAAKASESSELKLQQAKDIQEECTKEKERLRDLLIECKKADLDAKTSSEKARNDIAAANQKIAELNQLKDALTQEK